jgi:hypothetical protein
MSKSKRPLESNDIVRILSGENAGLTGVIYGLSMGRYKVALKDGGEEFRFFSEHELKRTGRVVNPKLNGYRPKDETGNSQTLN